MIMRVARPDGDDPQAECLREIYELLRRIDSQAGTLSDLVPYFTGMDQKLQECLAMLEMMAGKNDRLTHELAGKLRLIRQLGEDIDAKSREGENLERDTGCLEDEVRRLHSLVRLYAAALPTTEGGEDLRKGDRSSMNTNHPCRGLLFYWMLIVAMAFGIVGGIFADHLGSDRLFAVLAFVTVVTFVVAHVLSFIGFGQKPLRPMDLFSKQEELPIPALIQQKHDEAEAVRTRADGLDAKKQELADARVALQAAKDELDRVIREDVTDSSAENERLRGEAQLLYQEFDRVRHDAASTQDDIDAAEDAYDNAIGDFGRHAAIVEQAAANARHARFEVERLTTDITSLPAGLEAQVAVLQGRYDTLKAEEKAAQDAFDANKVEHANSRYTFARWYPVAAISFMLVIVTAWDYSDLNKIIGDARVANGREAGFFVSGDLKPAAGSKSQYVVDGAKLQLGNGGPVIVDETATDGIIRVYTRARLGEGVDWNRVRFLPMGQPENKDPANKK